MHRSLCRIFMSVSEQLLSFIERLTKYMWNCSVRFLFGNVNMNSSVDVQAVPQYVEVRLSETQKVHFSSAKDEIKAGDVIRYYVLHSKNSGATKGKTQKVVYNGLKNQGATCYLNSALQVLFMTKEFREAVERSRTTANDRPNDLLYQLQQLFNNLKDGNTCGSTVNITSSLAIKNVFEQQDAVEWFEKILSTVPPDVSQVYEGIWQKTLRCLKEDHEESHEDNSFFSLPLAMEVGHKDIFNVVGGLEAFFKTTRFDEDDWLYCDYCDEKTDTEISFNLQKHPTILNLHLKRFYFDYMKMGYAKNCCPVDIPLTLKFFKSCTYDLYGVVNHSGVYGGGHYYAYIKSPDNNDWYCFDDSQVSKLKDKHFLDRSKAAYMIVFRKRELTPSPKQLPGNNIESTLVNSATTEEIKQIKPPYWHHTDKDVLSQQMDHSPHYVLPKKNLLVTKRRRYRQSGPYQGSRCKKRTRTKPGPHLCDPLKPHHISPSSYLHKDGHLN